MIGHRIVRLETVGSTMDEVAKLAADGAEEGVVVVADHQTAGRGRGGRPWHAPPGSSLLCSILLRPPVPPAHLSTLPLIVGVAVAETIERVAPVRCSLKWPNDVWIDGDKVAGILLNARTTAGGVEFATLGIGINVNLSPADLPVGATSLLAASGMPADRESLLAHLVAGLDSTYRDFLESGGRVDLDPWRSRAALIGEQVVIRQDHADLRGRLLGVNHEGALLLEEEGGRIFSVVAGDVTRGPVVAYTPRR